jgi:hypothetical protein
MKVKIYFSLSEILDKLVNVIDRPGVKHKIQCDRNYLPLKLSLLCPSEYQANQLSHLLVQKFNLVSINPTELL